MNPYIGHELQLYGVEETRLVGGKGDGMRLFEVRNGGGLAFTVSADRCGDISRLSYRGYNLGYFSPCGYVAPSYYDKDGTGFLKSFTAGFFTTCGLRAVGSPCTDDGEELPLHGSIGNTPCENVYHFVENDTLVIRASVRDAALFGPQLLLEREYVCPIGGNSIMLTDKITNIGTSDSPLEVLYHCNMGYPLLSEKSVVSIPSVKVLPRNDHAALGINEWMTMEKPQRGYEEMCYYHTMSSDEPTVSIQNPAIGIGLSIRYNMKELPCFTEWKMMGEREYVLGLEPGNCLPDGRNVMRQKNMLEFLKPGESKVHHLTFTFSEE